MEPGHDTGQAPTETPRRDRVLAFVRAHVQRHGYAPSVREIGRAIDISSTSVVIYYLRRLADAGKLVRHDYVSRGLELPDAVTVFLGEEIIVDEVRKLPDGRLVGRVVEPVARAA